MPHHKGSFLITGVTSGIGEKLLKKIWQDGHTIDALVRNDTQGRALLLEYPERLNIYVCELRDADSVEKLAERVANNNYTHVVLNAGTASMGKIHETTPDALTEIFQVNLFSNLSFLRHLCPKLNKNAATVCLVSSLAARIPGNNYAAYGMSKASVSYLANALSLEYPNIRVLCAEIGGVNTPFHAKSRSGFDAEKFRSADATAQRLYRALTSNRQGNITLFPSWAAARLALVHFLPLILTIRRRLNAG